MSPVGLLATDRLVAAAGAAAALRLSRSGPVALVVLRDPETRVAQFPSPPPTPGAARLASLVRRQGHPAAAAWRLVRCFVSGHEEAGRLLELFADMDIPAVLASAAARSESIEGLLGSCDPILLVADDPAGEAVAGFAAAELAVAERACVVSLERVGAGSALAHAGIGAPPQWVEPLDSALGDGRESDVGPNR
jgi:hypothetical protein